MKIKGKILEINTQEFIVSSIDKGPIADLIEKREISIHDYKRIDYTVNTMGKFKTLLSKAGSESKIIKKDDKYILICE